MFTEIAATEMSNILFVIRLNVGHIHQTNILVIVSNIQYKYVKGSRY